MNSRSRGQHRIFFGALIILVGTLALLDNLHVFDAREVIHFWPMVFVVFGALKLYQARDAGGYVLGGALVAAGVLITLRNMGFITLHWRDWWPLLLIAGGVLVIATGIFGRRMGVRDGSVQTAGSESYVDVGAFMSGNNMYNDAQDFRGGEISAMVGGIEVDLRHASIQTEATIRILALLGGIVIKVPADWSVVTNCVPLLGGVDDKSVPPANPTKRLVIKGYAIMGGVEIKN